MNLVTKYFGTSRKIKAHMELQLTLICFLQSVDGRNVSWQLLRMHPEGRVIVPGEQVGSVVRKAQNFHSGFQSLLNVFFFGAHCVVAAGGMGMVVGNHGKFFL